MSVAHQSTPPTMSIGKFQGPGHGVAVEDYLPIVTVPYSPHMHSNCASYCYWFTCKLV